MKTFPTQRQTDSWGAGWFGAPRGSRTHHGIDLGAYPDMPIVNVIDGKVTKIGYPYDPNDVKKGHLRYIQITDADGRDFRYFYVKPESGMVVGKAVKEGDIIGKAQGLDSIYNGITDHIHFEVKVDGEYVAPVAVLMS